jgi:hypothetical protein
MSRAFLFLALLPILVACSGSDKGATGAGMVSARIGPSGGILKGPAGSELEGTIVTIPAGTLQGSHEVVVESAPSMSFPGAVPVGPAIRVRVTPDPGLLRESMSARVRVQLSNFLPEDDLLLLNGSQSFDLQGKALPLSVRPGFPGDGIVGNRKFFHGHARRTGVFQAFRTQSARNRSDAAKLKDLGLVELQKGRLSSLQRAGFWFESALEADPFSSDLRLLAALSRLLILLSSEDDGTSSIDSLGEALQSMGFGLGNKSILTRLFESDWDLTFHPSSTAPRFAAIQDFLDRRALPELHSILRDLDFISDEVSLRVDLGSFGQPLLGSREIDLGEVNTLRAFVHATAFMVDHVSRYDLEADLSGIHGKLRTGSTLADLLAQNPNLGTARVQPRSTEAGLLYQFLSAQQEGLISIDRERDDQRDDLLVFATWFDSASKTELLDEHEQALENLRLGTRMRTRMPSSSGIILVDIRAFLSNSNFSPRALLPEVSGNELLGSKIPDPTVGGLFPSLSSEQVLRALELPTRAELTSATIAIDGSFADWPAKAEILVPADAIGDAKNLGKLPAIDLHRVSMAKSGGQFAFKVLFADGKPVPNPAFATWYRIQIRDRAGLAASRREILVDLSGQEARAWILVPSDLPGPVGASASVVPGMRATEIPVALGPLGFEVAAQASAFGTRARERVLQIKSTSLDRSRGIAGGDRTRRVFLVF